MNWTGLAARASRLRAGTRLALAAAVAGMCAALPAAPAAGEASGSATAALSVQNPGGSAAELLRRLTVPQLAQVLHTTSSSLLLQMQGGNSLLGGEASAAAETSSVSVQELLGELAAHGISASTAEEAIGRLLAQATSSPQQLQATVAQVLSDLRENGQLGALARELALSQAALEAAQLLPSTAGQAAAALDTSAERLSSTLQGAGAVGQSLSPATPLVIAPLSETSSKVREVGGQTRTVLVGSPNGRGGLSLTTISSVPPASTSGAPAAAISNAFTIISIKTAQNGEIVETVQLPNPGVVAVKATTTRRVALRSRSGRRRVANRTSTLVSVRKALSAGRHAITFRPRNASTRGRRLTVALATTYTPTGGSPRTIKRSLVIGHARKSRRR